MRFNLSASVKHVAQLLNPDLEIPNNSTPASSRSPPISSTSSRSSSAVVAAAAAAASPPPDPSRSRGSALRSSLSLRRKRKKAALVCLPPPPPSLAPSSVSRPDDYSSTSLQADYAAAWSNTTRDLAHPNSSLRFHNTPEPPAVPKLRPAKSRASWNGVPTSSMTLFPAGAPVTTTKTAATAAISSSSSSSGSGRGVVPPTTRPASMSAPYFPLAGIARDGYSNAQEATATCFCGAVQLAFPVQGSGFLGAFVCNCADCRKITASMFASNFTVKDEYLKHLRGRANLSRYAQATTIASGHTMTNHFCSTCGSLMYRVSSGFPGCSILRLGTVDDFNLVETKLKPTRELFVKDRVSWFTGVQGHEVKRKQAML